MFIKMGFLNTLLGDYKTHREELLAQGFWALQIYRFGHLRRRFITKFVRIPICIIHSVLLKISEIFF